MTLHVASHLGFCFGVRDAVAAAERAAAREPVTLLGELVHNPAVQARLAGLGAGQADPARPGSAPTPTVLITAHGAAETTRSAWQAAGHRVIDTTCPLVHRAHQALRALAAAGHHPVIIGRRGHVEVNGLAGDHPDASLLEDESCLDTLPDKASFGVVAQTTQPLARVLALVEALRRARPGARVEFRDTVCQPTKDRQAALDALIARCEVVVVVGGRHSNNTRQLAATVRQAGRLAHLVESADELSPRWFEGVHHVGLTAGTSTPDDIIHAVRERLESFARAAERGLLTGHAA